jgi:hypothetical protein
MQRLFTMFPLGSAGIALLLLRLSAAAMLLMLVNREAQVTSQWAFAGLAILAVLLALGVFTPLVCSLCCCLEIVALFSLRGAGALHLVFTVVNTAALGLLGPGGFSLDARMFGRRRVVLSSEESAEF